MTKYNIKETLDMILTKRSNGKAKTTTVKLEFSFKSAMPYTMTTLKTLESVLRVYQEKNKNFKIIKEEVSTDFLNNKSIIEA